MDLLRVDTEKCVKCGLCVQACPSCILTMGEDGPKCDFDRGCMSCGHCVAICPMGALDNKYAPLEKQEPIPMPVLDSETAYNFLRMRRSVRLFKPEAPSDEDLTRLLDVCRYAPTAGNSQGLYYIVIRDRETIKKIADATAEWMQQEIEAGSDDKRYFTTVLRRKSTPAATINAILLPCCALTTTADRILSRAMRRALFLQRPNALTAPA